jgi:YD repeat-containing protein
VDELDRVTFVDYPGTPLDVTYTYDDPAVPFSLGRLTAITRAGRSVLYAYDRFGRTTQDGDLGYAFDENGNRTEIHYPGGVTATYSYDFADRQETLGVQVGQNPAQTLVSSSSYLPSGPLTSLALGNGLTETRTFDGRYVSDPNPGPQPARLDLLDGRRGQRPLHHRRPRRHPEPRLRLPGCPLLPHPGQRPVGHAELEL